MDAFYNKTLLKHDPTSLIIDEESETKKTTQMGAADKNAS